MVLPGENLNTNAETGNSDTPHDVPKFDPAAAEAAIAAVKSEQEQSAETEKKFNAVDSLASVLAASYVEENYEKLDDGSYKPVYRGANGERELRDVSPEDYAARTGCSIEEANAAITNLAGPFEAYSEHWKEENRGGARFIVGLIQETGLDAFLSEDLKDADTASKYGDKIHVDWLKRNESWAKDDPVLSRPFAELPPDEQAKDVRQAEDAQRWATEHKAEIAQWIAEQRANAEA